MILGSRVISEPAFSFTGKGARSSQYELNRRGGEMIAAPLGAGFVGARAMANGPIPFTRSRRMSTMMACSSASLPAQVYRVYAAAVEAAICAAHPPAVRLVEAHGVGRGRGDLFALQLP